MDSKNIKDYLHLYLGCEVYVFPDETLTNGWLETKRKEMPGLTYKFQLTISNYNVVLDAGYKPIPRPLSDMTEEESEELGVFTPYSHTITGKQNWTSIRFPTRSIPNFSKKASIYSVSLTQD